MTQDDRSPIVRLESRGARRGAASMADAVQRGLVRRRRRRAVAGLAAVVAVVVGVGVLLADSPPSETVIVPAISTPETVSSSPVESVEVPDVGAPFTVPTVLALTRDDAVAALGAAGYEWVIEFRADIAEVGLVISQDPAPGTILLLGESVTLVVSAGTARVVVPDLEGLALTEAIDLLTAAGFRIDDEPTEEPSEQIAEGLVIRTEPPTESLVASGSPIRIVISGELTTVVVPNVVGLFADTALQTLRTVGLVPVTRFQTLPFDDHPRVGLVIDQTPTNFSLVPIGSEVVIIVGAAGPAQTTSEAPS